MKRFLFLLLVNNAGVLPRPWDKYETATCPTRLWLSRNIFMSDTDRFRSAVWSINKKVPKMFLQVYKRDQASIGHEHEPGLLLWLC